MPVGFASRRLAAVLLLMLGSVAPMVAVAPLRPPCAPAATDPLCGAAPTNLAALLPEPVTLQPVDQQASLALPQTYSPTVADVRTASPTTTPAMTAAPLPTTTQASGSTSSTGSSEGQALTGTGSTGTGSTGTGSTGTGNGGSVVGTDGGTSAGTTRGWGLPSRVEGFDDALGPEWNLYDGPGHAGNGRRSPRAVSIAGGILTITGDSAGTTEGMAWLPGAKYGRWEGRVKAPASDPSYNALLLLWPDAENFPVGGEVDFMEMMDHTRQRTNLFLHYGASNSQVSGEVRIDATQWHNWAVEWTPTHIAAFVDGVEWWRTTNTSILPPGPMHLTIQLDWFPKGGSVQQSQMYVDWVKYYPLDGSGTVPEPGSGPGSGSTTPTPPRTTPPATTTPATTPPATTTPKTSPPKSTPPKSTPPTTTPPATSPSTTTPTPTSGVQDPTSTSAPPPSVEVVVPAKADPVVADPATTAGT